MKFKNKNYTNYLLLDEEQQKDFLIGYIDHKNNKYMVNDIEEYFEEYFKEYEAISCTIYLPISYLKAKKEIVNDICNDISQYKLFTKYKDIIDPIFIDNFDISFLMNNEDKLKIDFNMEDDTKTIFLDFKKLKKEKKKFCLSGIETNERFMNLDSYSLALHMNKK